MTKMFVVIWAVILMLTIACTVTLLTLQQHATQVACKSIHEDFKVKTKVIGDACYVRVDGQWTKDTDWTVSERLQFLERHQR